MWIKRISACWLPPNWSTAYKLTICIILGLMLKHWVESLNGRTQHTFFFGCVLCNSTPFVNPWISWSVGVFSFGQWWLIQTTFKAKIPATRPKSQPQGPPWGPNPNPRSKFQPYDFTSSHEAYHQKLWVKGISGTN